MKRTAVTSRVTFDEFKTNPAQTTREWRGHGAVVYSPDIDRWLVTRYDAVTSVLRSPLAASESGVGNSRMLINRNGERHREFRRPVLTGITTEIVDSFEPEIRKVAQHFVRAALREKQIDAVRSLAWPVSNTLFCLLFGSAELDANVRSGWNRGILNNGFVDEPQSTRWLSVKVGLRRAKRMLLDPSYQDYRSVRHYVERHFLKSQEANTGTPLTMALLDHYRAGSATLADLTAIGTEFIFATSEAPTSMLTSLLKSLVADRELIHKMRQDHALIEPFVEEVLRFDTPAQWLRRTVVDDIDVGGYQIPRGSVLLALIGSANRDEERFRDADQFKPERSPNPHLAFGMGPHSCPGSRLARLEARVLLEELLEHCGSLERQAPSELDEYRWLFAIRSLPRLNLIVSK